MQCNQENLQMYLDGEMSVQSRKTLEIHFGQCRSCRQEMARMQLLYLKLSQPGKIEIPPELPYLRQQVINEVFRRRKNKSSTTSYWKAQKLAWQPAIMGVSHIPGVGLISVLGRTAGRQIPLLMSDAAGLIQRLAFTSGNKKAIW